MLRFRASNTLLPCVLLALSSAPLRAQTMDDSLMMPRNNFCIGFTYQHNAWDQYWEGSLKRGNENMGKITTQNVSWMGNYGITNRLNVIATLPYVWTGASQGVLQGMKGLQDVTVAVKYNVLDTGFTSRGSLRTFVVASAGAPVGDYTPDFLPLSIGSASRSLSGRLTLHFQAKPGWFLRGTGAYTWRGNVTLDRPAYYTDGQLFHSDQVAMPDVFDYTASAGYLDHRLHVPVYFTQQYTRGGGDIRRQDMPFVSNRISGPSQFTVPPPAPVGSDAYRAELASIKTAQASLTDAQRESITYWSGGGVLRWNQILRELVARYNLPPAPRDNGTYVFPDANNPFADPAFPFANPPYAARAYSYVTVAQFEALKVAWAYKHQYGRPSPSRVDTGIHALMPTTDLPAYPSEDAVLSGVSTELLRALFPAAVEERSEGPWPRCSSPAPARTAWGPPSGHPPSGKRSRAPRPREGRPRG